MPFFNNIYYPYQPDCQGAQTSVGIPSLLSSPQSQRSSNNSHHTGSVAAMSTSAHSSSAVSLPPFRFRTRRENVDWRRISALDVDRVASELDFQTLQDHITGVTFCSVDAERCQRCQAPVDASLLKLFRLSQLTVEYLLHSQDYLSLSLQAAEERVQAEQREKEQMQVAFEKRDAELKSLKDELKQRKKIITSQQVMISSGMASYHKCQLCDKAFMNATFLHSHMQRRHHEDYDIKLLSEAQKKVQSVRFQEEIEKLKEQLSLTRSQLETQQQQQACMARSSQEPDLSERQEELKRELERWRVEERVAMSRQIEEIKESCQRDVNSLYHKNSMLEKELMKVQETNRVLVAKMEEEQDSWKKRTPEPGPSDGDNHKHHAEETRHQQEILRLEHLLQAQEEKWTAKLLKVQKENDTVKKQLREDLQHLQQKSSREQTQPHRQTEQTVKEGNGLHYQLPQTNLVSSKPSTVVKESPAPIPEPKAKPVVHDSSSISEKRPLVVREVQERVKAFLKNPGARREVREVVEQTLADQLHSLGVRPESQGLCTGEFERLMTAVQEKRRQQQAKGSPGGRGLRTELSRSLERRVKDRLAGCSSAPEKRRRTRDPPVAMPRALSNSLPSRGVRLVSESPPTQLRTPQAPQQNSRTKPQPSTSTPKIYPSSSDDDDDDDSEKVLAPQPLKRSWPRNEPVPLPRPTIPQVVVCREKPATAVDSDGTWTEGSELEEIEPKQLQNSCPVNQKTHEKRTQGHQVKDLTRSLENQLASQGPPKLAGSVNTLYTSKIIGATTPKTLDQVEQPKHTVKDDKKGNKENHSNNTNDEDDDDWDISSLDEASKPTSTLTPLQKTLESTSTSVWGPSTGHSAKPGLTEAGTASTLKSSLLSFSDWSSSED
ncbi:cilium assembly protein DZIP1 isoform X2 [Engraulis encrasicolus]|uniref:cilium assembly protein DZIP1 isoform X2 n=1 Tax=Engraulis encrasicolus TaxID=184585 RepID=UPI002FCE6CDF